ncbi:MAG: adenine nucleotide alpha hydrolase [Acidobacteria bacterium]|nr:adenine nucleotide alpha hydrolase [Acidobacteriota bacterium]
MKEKIIVAWSGGKDAAQALYALQNDGNVEIASLLTTVTEGYDRISMHGVRRTLLNEQAKALGLPLEEIAIPQKCSNEIYEQRMQQSLEKFQAQGISAAAFGDLFLRDVRAYREERMNRIGMKCLFPLWGKPTIETARRFIDLGFRAIAVCIDTQSLSADFAGREYDDAFLRDLPPGVDPCGENGEFHTFVYDGPNFASPVRVERGEIVLRDNRFCFCDLK